MNLLLVAICVLGLVAAMPTKRDENVPVQSKPDFTREEDLKAIAEEFVSDKVGTAIFSSLDTDKDGKINVNDFLEALYEYDQNHDGKISEKEYLENHHNLAMKLEESLGLSENEDGEVSIAEILDSLDNGGGSHNTKRGPEDGGEKDDTKSEEKTKDPTGYLHMTDGQLIFLFLDSNHDGAIEKDELTSAFGEIDVNADGTITNEEFAQVLGMMQAVVEYFAKLDVNHDKVLDRKEVLSAAIHDKHAAQMVTGQETEAEKDDAQERVTRSLSELDAAAKDAFGLSAEDILFDIYDLNADGAIDKEEHVQNFNAMDKDKSGTVSREEFSASIGDALKTAQKFIEADTNNDGIVSAEEFLVVVLKAAMEEKDKPEGHAVATHDEPAKEDEDKGHVVADVEEGAGRAEAGHEDDAGQKEEGHDEDAGQEAAGQEEAGQGDAGQEEAGQEEAAHEGTVEQAAGNGAADEQNAGNGAAEEQNAGNGAAGEVAAEEKDVEKGAAEEKEVEEGAAEAQNAGTGDADESPKERRNARKRYF